MTRILFTSDLHGRYYDQLFSIASRTPGLEGVLIGGDIAGVAMPKAQRDFVRSTFRSLLEKFSKSLPPVYIIPGNDDWKIVEKELQLLSQNHNLIVPTDRAYPLTNSISIVGYPYVPLTPFVMKDYEKWDGTFQEMRRDSELPGISKGYFSFNEEIKIGEVPREQTISGDMKKLAALSNPRKTVYLFHTPPKGIFDRTITGLHAGSRAVLEFILKEKPLLTLHGHIHEALENAEPCHQLFDSAIGACGQEERKEAYYLDIILSANSHPYIQRKTTS